MPDIRRVNQIKWEGARTQGPRPLMKEFMLETYHQMEYVAHLLERAGFKYIIGWKDVRGFGVYGVKNVEWVKSTDRAYINLRLS